jgi:hypothetical protein
MLRLAETMPTAPLFLAAIEALPICRRSAGLSEAVPAA